jgi:hypothetical protein
MLKGKALDMKGDYNKATEVFENNLKEYLMAVQKNSSECDETRKEIGNLEFRYGWSLIRSKKDVNQGLQRLMEAEKKMPENEDLKVKLAQILY